MICLTCSNLQPQTSVISTTKGLIYLSKDPTLLLMVSPKNVGLMTSSYIEPWLSIIYNCMIFVYSCQGLRPKMATVGEIPISPHTADRVTKTKVTLETYYSNLLVQQEERDTRYLRYCYVRICLLTLCRWVFSIICTVICSRVSNHYWYPRNIPLRFWSKCFRIF